MEFFNSFIPVHIKYEFHAENTGPHLARDWIECRLNVKPAPTSYRYVQINVYPKHYDEMTPHFTHDIDYTSIRSGGPIKSRSMENVFGVVWHYKQKKCRIFIALENKTMHQNFNKYFRKLLKYFNLYNNCENEHKVSSKNRNSSVCNEAEQMTASTSQTGASSQQIVCVSNASSIYQDVVLRPKDPESTCRLARSLAALSGLFKSSRENAASQEKTMSAKDTILPVKPVDCAPKIDKNKTAKRKNWRIFRSKQKQRDVSPTFQHFQEPLNIERMSLGPLAINSDAEWYDLNKAEMSLLEARLSVIVSQFNHYSSQSGGESTDGESIDGYKLSRSMAISSNILWSHNLSLSCISSDNASHINLLGANINQDQCHSDIYFKDIDEMLATKVNASFSSTDSNGYTVIQPIHSKKSHEPSILIDDITKSPNLQTNDNLNDSSNGSSGFDSDSDQNTPQKSIECVNSPATSDFSEAFSSDQSNECSPIPPVHTKNMQKTSKKCRLQIKSRKLFGKLYVKHNAIENRT